MGEWWEQAYKGGPAAAIIQTRSRTAADRLAGILTRQADENEVAAYTASSTKETIMPDLPVPDEQPADDEQDADEVAEDLDHHEDEGDPAAPDVYEGEDEGDSGSDAEPTGDD